MEDYSKYSVKELKSIVTQYDLEVSGTRKADYVRAVENYFDSKSEPVKTDDSRVILMFPGDIYSPGLGKVHKGYHIFDKETADKWLAVARRVRVADPEEVAAYYGV